MIQADHPYKVGKMVYKTENHAVSAAVRAQMVNPERTIHVIDRRKNKIIRTLEGVEA